MQYTMAKQYLYRPQIHHDCLNACFYQTVILKVKYILSVFGVKTEYTMQKEYLDLLYFFFFLSYKTRTTK